MVQKLHKVILEHISLLPLYMVENLNKGTWIFLPLMDYLIKNGSKKVIQHCREGFCNLQTLKDFQHVDEAGKDQGNG